MGLPKKGLWFSARGFALLFATFIGGSARAAEVHQDDLSVPHYDHIVVIVEENKSYSRIIGSDDAPNITAFARKYGSATHMFGEVHLSQGNYLAMIAGTTLGISDDDAWYCTPGSHNGFCSNASAPGYQAHSVANIPNLIGQLDDRHLSWRGYFGSIPADGSTAIVSASDGRHPEGLYAAKHNPFNNISSIRTAPDYAHHVVGLERFSNDVRNHMLPSFSFVVPNQCDEMHGLRAGQLTASACSTGYSIVRRGDTVAAQLIRTVQQSPYWQSSQNVAVVITFDEDDRSTVGAQGCCGYDPQSHGNFGGGHIPTIVITNHGPRHLSDATPYNHYSLLRTLDDAFGIHEYPGLADAWDQGVRPMTSLFAAPGARKGAP